MVSCCVIGTVVVFRLYCWPVPTCPFDEFVPPIIHVYHKLPPICSNEPDVERTQEQEALSVYVARAFVLVLRIFSSMRSDEFFPQLMMTSKSEGILSQIMLKMAMTAQHEAYAICTLGFAKLFVQDKISVRLLHTSCASTVILSVCGTYTELTV
jgi:hypothetical protein